ncbi:MAG: ferrous iron transport protein A [Planctomycetaceae bacterium]|nr:ferrous iron transport protein A [Planctomycetaceae bacterium]
MSHVVPLELLTAGEEARIVDVEGRPELVDRLAEMGLREGVVLRMVRPGQPCILAIGNHRLSFRGDEAASVFVEMVAIGSGT